MKKTIFALIAFCFILTGCFSNQTEEQPVTLTLDKVTAALKSEGIEMFTEEQENDWVLNKVKPNRYSVTRPNVKEAFSEYISIYVYSSETTRREGLIDFNNQKEKYNMQIPNTFEFRNVLILYWHYENMDKAEDAKFNKQIEMAINKI